MVTGPLVDEQIEDGQKLIAQLAEEGFDIAVACWVRFREAEEQEWFFYIVSERFDKDRPAAGLLVHQATHKIPPPRSPWITVSELRFAGLNDPVAKDVLAFSARYPGRTWFPGAKLGSKTIELAYIYPCPAKNREVSSARG